MSNRRLKSLRHGSFVAIQSISADVRAGYYVLYRALVFVGIKIFMDFIRFLIYDVLYMHDILGIIFAAPGF